MFSTLDHLIRANKFHEDYMEVGKQDFPEHTDYTIDKEILISHHAQQEENYKNCLYVQ